MSVPARSAGRRLADVARDGAVLRLLVIGPRGSGRSGVLAAIAESHPRPSTTRFVDDVDELTDDQLVELWADVRSAAQDAGFVLAGRASYTARGTLAQIAERLVGQGELVLLGPLDDEELSRGANLLLSAPASAELLDAVRGAGGGNPLLTRLLIAGWQSAGLLERGRLVGDPSIGSTVTELVRARVAQLELATRRLLGVCVVLAGRPDVKPTAPGAQWAELQDLALIDADRRPIGVMIERLAEVLDDDEEMDAIVEAAAELLAMRGASPAEVASLWRTRRRHSLGANAAFHAAAVASAQGDPDEARGWLALTSGQPNGQPAQLAALHVHLGDDDIGLEHAETAIAQDANDAAAHQTVATVLGRRRSWTACVMRLDLAVVDGAVDVQRVNAERALAMVAAADLDGARRAASAIASVGRSPQVEELCQVVRLVVSTIDEAERADDLLLTRFPEAIAALGSIERWSSAVTTPHEWLAAIALASGDARAARRILAPSVELRSASPALSRTRDLAGWVAVRLGGVAGGPGDLAPIDDLVLRLAVTAALSRRRADAKAGVELTRRLGREIGTLVIDPLSLDAGLELMIAAHRFGSNELADAMRDRVARVVHEFASPIWRVRYHWARLECAITRHEIVEAEQQAVALDTIGSQVARARPLARAAAAWLGVAQGRPDVDAVEASVEELRDLELVWEAAQLAGQAAIRLDDAGAAKNLLVRARSLRGVGGDGDRTVTPAGLSEREVEVAHLVLNGRTHRDIGEQLYISPKTVEHHVAHIRTKLGVSTRAEFLSALRQDLADRLDQPTL